MQNNSGQCPSCKKTKAMKAVTQFGGRDWPGSMCRFCAFFVPDIQSKYYDLSCADCDEKLPFTKALDYHFSERTEEENAQAIADEEARAKAAKDELYAMAKLADDETDPAKKLELSAKLRARAEEGRHRLRPVDVRTAWDKRHQEHLKLYNCADCHKERRKKGVKFGENGTMTYVRHVILCVMCKKPQGAIDCEEDMTPEEQQQQIELNRLVCPGECTEKHVAIQRMVRAKLKEELAKLPNLSTGG